MKTRKANPGPSWGFSFLRFSEKHLPRPIFDFLLSAGTAVSVGLMKPERQYSREYLQHALKRKPSMVDVWKHFNALSTSLVQKLKVGDGSIPHFTYHQDYPSHEFHQLITSETPAIMGTFHLGQCDLMGCMLGDYSKKIAMVRLKVGNSKDLEFLEKQFGNKIDFLWINQPEEFLFSLKETLQTDATLALQCDRPEFSQRVHAFQFLGTKRSFPVTIYQLAYLFKRPVAFAFATSDNFNDNIQVIPSSVFHPLSNRKANEAAGIAHFQQVLNIVEDILSKNPYLWFNFLPFNPSKHEA